MRPWVLSMSTDRKGKAYPLLFWRVVSKLTLCRGMPPYLLPTLATTLFWLLSSVHLFPLSDITKDKAWRRPGWSPILFCFSSTPSKFWPFPGGFVCLSLKFASRSNVLFYWLIERYLLYLRTFPLSPWPSFRLQSVPFTLISVYANLPSSQPPLLSNLLRASLH